MRVSVLRPVILLLAATLAGCVDGDDAEAFSPTWSVDALPWGAGHDHNDRSQHTGLSTSNFQIIGHEPLISEHYGAPAAGYFCGDTGVASDGRQIAAVESRSDVGFAFLDVTDPTAPQWLGELVMPTTHVYDLAVVPDSPYVALATSKIKEENLPVNPPGLDSGPSQDAFEMTWRDGCGERPVRSSFQSNTDPVPRPGSLILVDVLAEGGPTIVEQHPLAGFGHSVMATIEKGQTWLLVSTTYFYTDTTADIVSSQIRSAPSAYELYTLTDVAGDRLDLWGVYRAPAREDTEPGFASLGPRAHDGWIHEHPITGGLVAYLAGGDRVSIVEWSERGTPTLLSEFTDVVPGRSGHSGHMHSTFPLGETVQDGRHYTVVGPEFGNHPTGHPSGIVWVLDTTDPAAPGVVGAWTLPHDVAWEGTYQFSNHYFLVDWPTLLISMYHGGIWAIDLAGIAPDTFTLLPSIGVFMPDIEPTVEPANRYRWTPTVEEVLRVGEGQYLTFDGDAGAVLFTFDPDRPAPAPEPWPIESV